MPRSTTHGAHAEGCDWDYTAHARTLRAEYAGESPAENASTWRAARARAVS